MNVFLVTSRECHGKLVCAKDQRQAKKAFATHRGVRVKPGKLPEFYATQLGFDGPFVLAGDLLTATLRLFGASELTANSRKVQVLSCTRLVLADLGFRLWVGGQFRALYSFDQFESMLDEIEELCRRRNLRFKPEVKCG